MSEQVVRRVVHVGHQPVSKAPTAVDPAVGVLVAQRDLHGDAVARDLGVAGDQPRGAIGVRVVEDDDVPVAEVVGRAERGEALRRAASAPSFPASRQKAWAASSDIESADRLAKPEDRRQARRRK